MSRGVTPAISLAVREKAVSHRKPKPLILNRIDTFSHCGKRLQRTSLNMPEIGGLVLTMRSDQRLFSQSQGGFYL
jgi:hypothetical protein